MRRLLPILMLGACLPGDEPPSITVVGTATYEAQPTAFVVKGNARAQADDEAAVLAALGEQMAAVRNTMPALEGLEAIELTTRDFSVRGLPEPGCVQSQRRGNTYDACPAVSFVASVPIQIQGRPAEAAGNVVSLLSELVDGDASLQRFVIEDADAAKAEAMARAIRAGRAEAEQIADAAGATLGTLLSAAPPGRRGQELGSVANFAPPVDRIAARPVTTIDLTPPPVEFDATITLTFEIAD